MLIDSHCHLDFFEAAEILDLRARAAAAGVREMVTIGTRLSQASRQINLADAHETVWCTIGTHPHHTGESPTPDPAAIAALTRHDKVIGIGESGLDYFYDSAPRRAQHDSFRAHIAAARLSGLPLVIHARSADDDMIDVLTAEIGQGAFAFLLHCFSSGRRLAEHAVALGGYISFSGILTFPKSVELRHIAADLPADRLLVETDSPYLAPVPFRGKRCEPAYTRQTAELLAGVRGLGLTDLATLTTQNFRRLFHKTAA